MKPADIERVFGRGRLKMMTGEHVEVFREEAAPGERRRYTKRFLSTTEGDFRHWTEREWRILARLVGHGIGVVPDVVQFDRGNRDRPALVQTYDAGITVDHWATLLPVERDGTVLRHVFEDCAHWWALAQHCLIALDTIHELDLVHLDLKADNVCIPFGPGDFDPHAPDQVLRPLFPQISLIDFAFSLVSGERLANALPIGHQTEDEYQSPRLLRALEAGRHGDLQPTRDLDWRCDLFSLAAMLNRYLPPTPFIAGGWTGACHRKAQSLICRLYDAHHEPLPSTRPHRQFIASTEQVLGDPALAASLERGWLLALDSELSPIDTPTPVTRIAVPVPVSAVTTDLFAGVASAPLVPPRPRRRIAPWAWGTAVVATGALSVPLMSGDWAPWRSGERVASVDVPQRDRGVQERVAVTRAPADAPAASAVMPVVPPHETKAVVASTSPRPEPAAAPAVTNPPATRTASAEPASNAGTARDDTPASPPVSIEPPAPSHVATQPIEPAPAKPAAPTRAPAPHTAVAKAAPSSTAVAATTKSTRHAHAAKPPVATKATTLAKSTPARTHAAAATTVAVAAPAAARAAAAATPSAPIAVHTPAPAFAMAAMPPRDSRASTSTTAAAQAPTPAVTTPAPAPSPVIAAAAPAPPPAAPPVALVSAAPSAISTGPSAARPALLLSDDFSERAEELLTQHLPRIAQRAERMVLRVLHIAAEADSVGQERDVRDAARVVRNVSDDALAGITTSTIEARRLKEAAANAFWSERNARRASTLQARAFGADPLDAETAGDLAFYLLKQRPAPAEIARELALYALTTSQGNAPGGGRLQDWTSFAIASALTGRQRDASNALYVTLALSDNVDLACRAALAAYASHGERMRAPAEAMLYRIQSWGRSGESTFCRWPPSWAGGMRGR